MATTTVTRPIPGYLEGTWAIDPSHSIVGFSVRHLMVSKVRGHFSRFEGTIRTGAEPLASSVDVTVDLTSIETGDAGRDEHLRSTDFFAVDEHPTMTYRSTGVRAEGDGFVVDGELTLHGVTRPLSLEAELNGFQAGTPFGDTRVGFSARGTLDRRDFGIAFNIPMEGGGVVVSERVQIELEAEAILEAPAA
jgi:polyisoprenoid-binding protein YceI